MCCYGVLLIDLCFDMHLSSGGQLNEPHAGNCRQMTCTFTVEVCCVPIHGISIVGISEACFEMLMNVMDT